VSHGVNNRILSLAHLTRVAHPHRVTRAPFTRVTLLHRVTRVTLRVMLFTLMLVRHIRGGVSMGNSGTSPTANLPYLGGTSTSGIPGFPAHTTPINPNPNFQHTYHQTMAYGPNIPPRVRVFLTVLFLTYFSLGHRLTLLLTRG
jgi:hypothetical protein